MKKIWIFFILLTTINIAYAQENYEAQVCMSAKETTDKVSFSTQQVKKIVTNTGMDQRSICHFIQLGSFAFPTGVLKAELLEDHSQLKLFLNQHYLFKPNSQFFQTIADFLFSEKVSELQQVMNTFILSDLLYGYKIGETLEGYMQEFLFYSTANSNKAEQDAMNKIMPYLLYIGKTHLKKEGFNETNTQKYIKKVQEGMKDKIQNKGKKNQQPNNNLLQDQISY